MSSSSVSDRKVIAVPFFPARPVRPARNSSARHKFEEKGKLTDSMNVSFDIIRHLEIDDERDVRNIDTTTSEIRSDQDIAFSISDRIQRCFSLFLILSRMQCRDVPLRICGISEGDTRGRKGRT